MSIEIKAVPGIIRTNVPNTDTGHTMCAVTFYLDAAEAHRFLALEEGQTVTLTVPEGKPVKPVCICPRFGDTGGMRIADLTCPVHGVNGTEPGDGQW